jgi:hypothetical protein
MQLLQHVLLQLVPAHQTSTEQQRAWHAQAQDVSRAGHQKTWYQNMLKNAAGYFSVTTDAPAELMLRNSMPGA